MKGLNMVALLLVVVGGLNWGLVGAFNFNLVDAILGSMPWLESLVYILVGLSAVLVAVTQFSGKGQASGSGQM